MIGKAPKAAQHDILVLRQFLAGRKRCAPHPLNNRDVRQHRWSLDAEFAEWRDHDSGLNFGRAIGEPPAVKLIC
jgi:hypothetical protein